MNMQENEDSRISLDRIVLMAVGTASLFLSIGAWVLTELTR